MKSSRVPRLLQVLAGIILLVGCKGGSAPVVPPGTVGPKAAFTHPDPNDCVVGKTLIFDASGSTDSLTKIAQYVWDWGDKTVPSTNTTPGASHVFAKAASYKVTLTIIDRAEIKASTSQQIHVLVPGAVPEACFSYQAPNGWQAGSIMKFDASCSSDPDNNISTYQWDWGDGSKPETFNVPTAEHAFTSESSFQVRLKVIDATGREALSEPTEISTGHPSGPHVVASAEIPNYPIGIAISGNFAYVITTALDSPYSLEVYGIQNPHSPTHVASMPLADNPSQIVIEGSTAYIYAVTPKYTGVLDIVNISNPTAPSLITKFTGFKTVNQARIVTFEHYLLICQVLAPMLTALDISNPASPVEVGFFQFDDYISAGTVGLDVTGNACYILLRKKPGDPLILKTVDLTNPSHMYTAWENQADIGLNGFSIAASSTMHRLVALGDTGFYAFDITNPLDPTLINKSPTPLYGGAYFLNFKDRLFANDAYAVYLLNPDAQGAQVIESAVAVSANPFSFDVSGNYVFAACWPEGLQVIDFSPPGPRPVAKIDISEGQTAGYGTGYTVINGNYAYVSAGIMGAEIIDISQPWNPAIVRDVNDYDRYQPVQAIFIRDKYLYLFMPDKLVFFDLTNPIDPVKIGEIALPQPNSSSQTYISADEYYCIVDAYSSILIIDVRNPVKPKIVGPIKDSIGMGGAASGSNLLVPEGSGIAVYGMSDPGNPVKGSQVNKFGSINSIQVSGKYLFGFGVSQDGISRFEIFDISDIDNPALLGSTPEVKYGTLTILGACAYVTSRVGVDIIDLSDPAHMRVVAFAPVTPKTNGGPSIAISGRYIFSADGYSFQTTRLW